MEFLSGYAAARAPYLTYEVEGAPPSRSSKPTRTNSTAGTTSKKKRSRIPGHARTNSASTSSSGGQTDPHHSQANVHPAGSLHPSSAAAAADPSGAAAGGGDGGAGGGAGGAGAAGGVDPATGAPLTLTLSAGDSAVDNHHHHHHHNNQQQQQHHYQTPKTRRSSSTRDRDRDRMHSSFKYFQDKQLPATPRLNTHDLALKHTGGAGSGSGPGAAHPDPASARTPASAGAVATFGNPGAVVAAVAFPDHRRSTAGPHTSSSSSMAPYPDMITSGRPGGARAESISSVSGATTTSNRTMHSAEHPAAHDSAYHQRPFVVRNGRTYLADPTLPYPLPVDLEELHRQSLKTMLLMQLFGGPICAPGFADKPPLRILEVGCGTGFWSMMCYKHYEARGQAAGMTFTGIDLVPLPPNAAGTASSPADLSADTRPDKDMSWRFVQHDLRKLPLPFAAGSFDFVMAKDMTLVVSLAMQQSLIEEYVRILSPGGAVEIWETDHVVRMLRPHVPDCATTSGGPTDDENTVSPSSSSTIPPAATATTTSTSTSTTTDPTTGGGDDKQTALGGAYIMTGNTPLSTPLNNFLVDYNHWALRALESRSLCAMPCTAVGPLLVQEAEDLTGLGSRRLAVPLSEIRWEREGVGGVVTKDGKSYIETKARAGGGSGKAAAAAPAAVVKEGAAAGGGKGLEPAAAALRRTALLTVVQQIQSLEPMLREVAGKSQDEWDTWLGKMMNDLVRENGTNWGECLEVGAWWARRR